MSRSRGRKFKLGILHRDGYTCVYCNLVGTADSLTIDHVVPVALGGKNVVTNKATCCRDCNRKKAAIRLTSSLEMVLLDQIRSRTRQHYNDEVASFAVI